MKRLLLLALVLVFGACGRSLERQVQDQVRTLDRARLGKNQVKVENVQTVGNSAVAEVQIRTAVRLSKHDEEWVIDEIRIGDRRWERIEHILQALREERTETTKTQLNQISRGLRQYYASNGNIPQVSEFNDLIDLLTPHYLDAVTRIDAWSNPFYYEVAGPNQGELRSAGPDGSVNTGDDLVLRIP